MKPILYVDLDNVVFDTVDAIKTLYDEDFRLYDKWEDVPVEEIKSYNFDELCYLDKKRLNEYFNSGRFFDAVCDIEGAEFSLATFNGFQDFPIVFVSIGTPENIKGKTIWVQRFNHAWSTDAEFIGLHSFDKSEIDMSGGILIDDELKNLSSSNADMKICFGNYEWNKDWNGIRAENWSKLRQIIYGEVKRRESNDQT